MNIAELVTGKGEARVVLFHSRYRNHRIVFGKDLVAAFSNYALALPDTEAHAELIKRLRDSQQREGIVEVDLKKKKEADDKNGARVKQLEKELEDLKALNPTPRKQTKVTRKDVAN